MRLLVGMLRIRVLVALLVALCPLACVRTAPLVNPAPLGTNPDLDVTRSAIHHAISRTVWTVEREVPGEIQARLAVRTHRALVSIRYDARKLQLTYLSSENLKYAKFGDHEEIHKQYNVWVDELMTEIKAALQSQQRFPAPPLPGQAPSAAPPPPPPPAPIQSLPSDGGVAPTPPAPAAPAQEDRPRAVTPLP